ncbi:hypothetical protein BVRB_2g030470 [Beta vulgaris subsp. vulgaris]|nr:hypothetical protein BVRB_2g030470 [Beta vulgaris subsp. vulgaris]
MHVSSHRDLEYCNYLCHELAYSYTLRCNFFFLFALSSQTKMSCQMSMHKNERELGKETLLCFL